MVTTAESIRSLMNVLENVENSTPTNDKLPSLMSAYQSVRGEDDAEMNEAGLGKKLGAAAVAGALSAGSMAASAAPSAADQAKNNVDAAMAAYYGKDYNSKTSRIERPAAPVAKAAPQAPIAKSASAATPAKANWLIDGSSNSAIAASCSAIIEEAVRRRMIAANIIPGRLYQGFHQRGYADNPQQFNKVIKDTRDSVKSASDQAVAAEYQACLNIASSAGINFIP